jgi:hypothetical protein
MGKYHFSVLIRVGIWLFVGSLGVCVMHCETNPPKDKESVADASTAQPETKPEPKVKPDVKRELDSKPKVVSFKTDILPLFKKVNCTSSYCHGGGSGGLMLSRGQIYQNLVNVKSKKNSPWMLVVPKEPEKSLLFNKISKAKPAFGEKMPIGGTLAPEEVQKFKDWILAGALDN